MWGVDLSAGPTWFDVSVSPFLAKGANKAAATYFTE